MATSTLPSLWPKEGRNCYATCVLSGVPKAKRGEKIRCGYLNGAFPGAQEKAEILCNPCILGDPQRKARGENQKWLPQPYFLGGPKKGGILRQPLHSRGGGGLELATSPLPSGHPKKGRNFYGTLGFSGAPNDKCRENIRSGYLTRAFSGPQEMAELLRNPCILEGPQRQARRKNRNCLPNPCFLRGPKEGDIAT